MTSLPPESQPSYEAAGQYAPPPAAPVADGRRSPGSKTLGVVAFIAALVAAVGGSILTYVGGTLAGGVARYAGSDGTIDTSAIPADAQASFATGGLLVVLGFAVLGIFALWALIQGIIAAVKNRGRGWGIAAIIVGVLAFIPVSALLAVGTAAGISAA